MSCCEEGVIRKQEVVLKNQTNSNSSSTVFPAEKFDIDKKLLIDPKLLFIGAKIGEGAHGKVYEGRYGNQIIAVKVLNCGSNQEERDVLEGRFVREVSMMSRVKHANLVKFIGACKDPIMVIATELLPGMSLRKYLLSIRPKRLDIRVAIGYALDIARAMECLHANGVIHRDLKPGTAHSALWIEVITQLLRCVMTMSLEKSVKLADFGLAREESVTEMMTAETGTYRWMAPELYSTVTLRQGEKKHYNNKVDVYSFGIVLWELLTNRMPFEGMSNLQAAYAAAFKQMRPSLSEDIPPDLAFIVQSCWVEDANVRPSFSQIIRMLNTYLITVLPPPPPPPEPATVKVAVPCKAIITESSARGKGKFAFLRQFFTMKRTKTI
ncbi:hypothetical protein C5167_024771 [Papaver somniferum]|uniref:Protein kinase domain-containing protein n=1 Tax=Papaver somniferum TaxID=3469 RepID=A0A4Y7JR76_PAPSO|nr:hypothetical protein C5167_024771 [Papaver somniferum]